MIRVQHLSKFYGGKRALGPVTFEIEDGETVGFLGLNGAGKTTALRILACDLRPSAGTVSVGGVDAVASPHEVRKLIGFLPENPPLYVDMHVVDYLRFAGELRGMRRADINRRMPEVLDLTQLRDVQNDVIGTLSHGYRQRVGVAQAIIHNPKFLILDEPTRGLDPVQIVEMRNLVHDLKQSHTVLISSHILTEISATCDRLIVLGKGAILGVGSETQLASREEEIRKITVAIRPAVGADVAPIKDAAVKAIAAVDGVTGVAEPYDQGGNLILAVSMSRDARADVSRAVVGGGFDLVQLAYSRSELEDTFIRLVGGGDASN